ncbi:MAG: HXXEE domain-containing protein [Methanomicrobiales archaeon]
MDLNILWLVPIAYLIHIFEESPRFPAWAVKVRMITSMSFGEFALGNIIFMAYVLVSVSLAIFYTSELTLVLGLSAVAWIFSNFLVHAYYTLRYGEYSPGVITASALYAPVTVFIFYNFLVSGILNTANIILAIIIGFGVMYVPLAIQMHRTRTVKKSRTAI